MGKKKLRAMTVDGGKYLYQLKDYYDIWEGKLVVYLESTKSGCLKVKFAEKNYFAWKGAGYIVVSIDNSRVMNIHEPEPISRIIRFARQNLNWQAEASAKPLFIEDGYEILKQLGYIVISIEEYMKHKRP